MLSKCKTKLIMTRQRLPHNVVPKNREAAQVIQIVPNNTRKIAGASGQTAPKGMAGIEAR